MARRQADEGLNRQARRGTVGRKLALLVLLIAVFGGSVIFAADGANDVRLMVGRSTVLDLGSPIARVSLTSADIADALVTSPNELLINGKMPGTISMFVWDRSGGIRRFEVVVQRDLARLAEQVKSLFPGESISVASGGKSIVLSGSISSKELAEKAIDVAAGYVDKRDEIVNLLQVRDGVASNQVLLRVRFAEVSRTALMELGTQLFTGPGGYKDYLARSTTGQFPAPIFDDKGGSANHLVFTDYLNLFLFNTKNQLGFALKALQSKGLFQTLAEPNLVAESGKEASFLAGGEFPVPIAQPSGGAIAITVVFKEFGIRLNFTPVVNGDRIHLKVRPEVSTLDFNNAVTLQGFRIPALSTRRTETELELMNGQTFAIAGLLDNTVTQQLQKVPGIGDIPILGELFKSRSAQKDRTELVVMITPEILPRNSDGVTPDLPRTPEQFLPPLPDKKTVPPQPPAFKGPRGNGEESAIEPAKPTDAAPAAASPAIGLPDAPANPATAAASVSALTPMGRPVIHAVDVLPSTPVEPPPVVTEAPAPPKQQQAKGGEPKEQDAIAPATKEDRKRAEAEARARANEEKRQAKLAKAEADREREEAKRQALLDREQAKRQAALDKKQAEIDQKEEKALAEAAARLKAAQDAYQAEASKRTPRDPKVQ